MKTRKVGRKVRLTPDEIAFLDGYLSAFEDLPDGAWRAACEEAIAECADFNGRDPYEVWITWVIANSKASCHDYPL